VKSLLLSELICGRNEFGPRLLEDRIAEFIFQLLVLVDEHMDGVANDAGQD
jgi:hypothetical protein